MIPNDYLNKAISEVNKLNQGEIFLVRELFKGYEWNRIKTSDRLKIGTLFVNHIESNPDLKIRKIEKSSSNQQKYEKM